MSTTRYAPRLKASHHQFVATEKMTLENVANFDDQGLGKTKQCYDTIAKFFEKGLVDLAIVVAKASLRENIFQEIRQDASQLKVDVIGGSKQKRLDRYRHLAHHVIIISYETLITDINELSSICKINRVLIAFDESHYLKNSEAKRTSAAIELSKQCIKALIFSGTPAPNGIKDLYPQLKILGMEIGENLEDFNKRFDDPEKLREFLKNKFIRRKKEDLKSLNLPAKKVHIHSISLSPEELRTYNSMKAGILCGMDTSKSLNLSNVLSRLSCLLQFTSDPRLLDFDFKGAKFKELIKVLESYLKDGRKIVVWTSYRQNVFRISEELKDYNPVTLIGGLTKNQRKSNSLKFKEEKKCQVLIATPACAREGFTLTSAHVAIYLDRNFSYLDWAQSQDRIHRITQKSECQIICIQAKGTIDEKIDEILDLKGDIQAFLLGDNQKVPKQAVTYERLMEILK